MRFITKCDTIFYVFDRTVQTWKLHLQEIYFVPRIAINAVSCLRILNFFHSTNISDNNY